MKQIQRIQEMEQLLDETYRTLTQFEDCLERYVQVQNKLHQLETYYTSKLWMKDFEDDNSGKFPQTLKRGVLSEDGIHDLLERNKEIHQQLQQFIKKRD